MSKAATLPSTSRDAHYKAQADHYLTETRMILRRLAAEREREARRRRTRTGIVEEVRDLLRADFRPHPIASAETRR